MTIAGQCSPRFRIGLLIALPPTVGAGMCFETLRGGRRGLDGPSRLPVHLFGVLGSIVTIGPLCSVGLECAELLVGDFKLAVCPLSEIEIAILSTAAFKL